MKKFILYIIIIVIAAIGFFTNPSQHQHEEAVKQSFRNGLGKALKAHGIKTESGFFDEITGNLFDNVIWDELMTSSVKRDNYFLFSVTKVKYIDKEYTAGIGAFGQVYIFKKAEEIVSDKVNELINKGGGLKKSLGF